MEFTKQPHDNIPASRAALKLALFAVLVFIIGALQVSLFSKVRLFSATPDILLALVLGLGVFDGERTGAVIGVWAGVVSDALGGSVLMFSPFFYLMAGYLAGIAVKTLLGKNFPSWLVLCFAGCTARAVMTLICIAVGAHSPSFATALLHVVLPEFASTYLPALPVYFLARLLCRPFHKSMEMS